MWKKGAFKFNGKTSEDFGLVIQTPPTYNFPERDLSSTHIPGRNGDLIIDNKCYKNVTRSYLVGTDYYYEKYNEEEKKYLWVQGGYYDRFEQVLNWLNSANGKYVELTDTYDSEVYRLASFQMNGSFTNYYDQGGSVTIDFVCKPQRFLKTGNNITEYKPVLNSSTNTIDDIAIYNEYSYTALPVITIENINSSSSSKVLMVTVFSGDATSSSIGEELHCGENVFVSEDLYCGGSKESSDSNMDASYSNITISNYQGALVLDSEEQTITDLNLEDKYEYVNLNGTSFPSFKTGNNRISLAYYNNELYKEESSYSKEIMDAQSQVSSEYKTFAAMQQSAQEKVFLRSYNALKSIKQKTYNAKSAQSLLNDSAESYTFESFNTLLNSYAQTWTFAGSASDNNSTKPEWIGSISQNGNSITITAKQNGFYMVKGSDKKIKYVVANGVISSSLRENTTNTVIYYEADSNGLLKVTYDNIPSWLLFTITYDNERSPIEISYSFNSIGWIWIDKSWTFGKAKWQWTNTKTVLNTLKWSTSKTAFMSPSLSLSTTTNYTYKFYKADSANELPEYKQVEKETIDDNGVKTVEITSPVYFIVESLDGNASKIAIKAKESGIFLIQNGNNSVTETWRQVAAGETILSNVSGTDSFDVKYFNKAPDYSGEENWVDWLDPHPETASGSTSDVSLLNANVVYLKVKVDSNYRISAKSEDDTPKNNDDPTWVKLKAGESLIQAMNMITTNTTGTSEAKTVDTAFYVYKLDEFTTNPTNNRGYYIDGSKDMSVTPPSWLTVKFSEEKDDNGIPKEITYSTKLSGYYRYDNNTVWSYHSQGEDLVTVSGTSNTVLYYLSKLPDHSTYSLLTAEVKESSTGNPEELIYTVNETGYYRYNNVTTWKYVTAGSELFRSKISQVNYIYHLEETSDSKTEVQKLNIKIKPRWWVL